jgi:hypothetical protein
LSYFNIIPVVDAAFCSLRAVPKIRMRKHKREKEKKKCAF